MTQLDRSPGHITSRHRNLLLTNIFMQFPQLEIFPPCHRYYMQTLDEGSPKVSIVGGA